MEEMLKTRKAKLGLYELVMRTNEASGERRALDMEVQATRKRRRLKITPDGRFTCKMI